MNWKVGDRAILVGLHDNHRLNGTKVTVLSELRKAKLGAHLVHEIDLQPPPGKKHTVVRPEFLRPIPDDFTRFHAELCEKDYTFKPKELCDARS